MVSLPTLPALASTNWFGWAQALDAAVRALPATVADNAAVQSLLTAFNAHTANTGNPHAVTKAQVGLANVDNTADTAKPVSTLQQQAINTAINNLINGAPAALDTITELAAAMQNEQSATTTLTNGLAARLPMWQANTTYTAGAFLLNPSGLIVTKNATGSSGATYTASDYTTASGLTALLNTKSNGLVTTVADQAGMLALSTARHGDVVRRQDLNFKPFMLVNDTPGTLANWVDLTAGATPAATDVTITAIPGVTGDDVQSALADIAGRAGSAGTYVDTNASSLTSDTTYVDQTALNVAGAAGDILWLTYELECTSTTASVSNLEAALTVPNGCTGTWSSSLDYDAAGSSGAAKGALAALTTTRTFKLSSNNVIGVVIKARVVFGATGGNVVLRLRQDTADPVPVTRNAYAKVDWIKAA